MMVELIKTIGYELIDKPVVVLNTTQVDSSRKTSICDYHGGKKT